MSELGDILWTPSAERIAASHLARFAAQSGFAASDYAGLHAWSVRDAEAFYNKLWTFVGIIGEKGSRVMQPAAALPDVRFFPDAHLSYAENVLRDPDQRLALIAHREDGTRRQLTRRELADLVSRMAQALRAEGVAPGDRVAAIVTNDIEAIALYLATAAVGAIWAACSPDFGPAGASDRLVQVAPVLLFAVPHYSYAGRLTEIGASIAAVAAAPSIRRVVLLAAPTTGTTYGRAVTTLDAWLLPYAPAPIDYHRGGFGDPLAILFSSGTTGKPKCIVHTAGGLLLQHMKEHQLHCDIKPGERLFYYTTCSWMMWNWLVTGLASGATLVTYDGNPVYSTATRLIDLIDAEAITAFGTSARYIESCRKAGLTPRLSHSLASLRTILSTGSPLPPEGFGHIYAAWKPDVHLASISGGTDICACFLGGVPTLPVRRSELQGALLGMDVAILGGEGAPVAGGPGELVCRNAHVSMPAGFWGDADRSQYRGAYFERFPDVWTHGDYVEPRPSGGFVILGRSDTTLNPSGVRIGTAEIYQQVESIQEVFEAVVVGQDWEGDQRIVLFVRLRDGAVMTEDLRRTIRTRIRSGATPRHVPAKIVAVREIPRTRSGKISEAAVRDTIHNRPIANVAALVNPECLSVYRDLLDLSS